MTQRVIRIAAVLALAAYALPGGVGLALAADTAATTPAATVTSGIPVAVLDGKVTLQVPADFVNQTREDSTAANTGVKTQVFADRKRQQVIGVSEVPTADGDANDTSPAAFNKMSQGSLSGLKTQYKDVTKIGQTTVTAGDHKFLRLDTRQSVQGTRMLGSTITTPYNGSVITIQVLSPANGQTAHTALVKQILASVAFH